MKFSLEKSDTVGAFASALCMLHCIATPFIFIAQTCSVSCCSAAPEWWQWIDYLFLIISLSAIWQSTKTTSSFIIRPLLWITWLMLFTVTVNEKIGIVYLPKIVTYIVAFTLIGLHIFNLKYCQCENEKCCVNDG